ncbi:MAG TPA: tripartite tricarboxylate transporter substrate binding protein [Xanthobacteraceae bacterium]|nr:tripartite tricarboxylate transporter substrate binding protein [Xanthobacteraceae bacterium]
MLRKCLLFALALLAAASVARAADTYPSRPIHFVIPFPPGGSNDVVGRVFAAAISERLGQPLVVENRPGAGGVVGTELVAKAAPDGYTLLVISLAHAVNPWLYKLNYDPIKAFAPIGSMGSGTNVLVVNPTLPAHSVKELVALAKAKPGELNYASAGIGSFQHLGGELFKLDAGVDIVHVPFRGGGPAMLDVLAGNTKIMFSSLVQTMPFIRNGQLRALGTGGAERSPVLPDVPTIAEAGVPGYQATNWWGIIAPAGTPPEIIAKVQAALAAAQDSAEVQKQLEPQGADVVRMSSAAFGAFMQSEMDKWGRVVAQAGIKAQ